MLSLQYCFHSSICCKDMKYLKIWGEKGVPQQTVTAIMIYPVSTGLLCATLSEMQLALCCFQTLSLVGSLAYANLSSYYSHPGSKNENN